ncbi:MAG: ABC transporter ATP-binding protein, partial [Chloroflexi bacterium]|nr:ABC transporter ATP-binding protein [Chloroflexota bacterium]
MLKLANVAAAYGQVQALRGVSLEVQSGQIATMIGANGAGKSSTLKVISGLLRPSGGSVEFDGRDLAHIRAEDIVRLGIVHVPEGRRLFPGLSVRDNLMLSASSRASSTQHWKADARDDIEKVYAIFPPLRKLDARLCWTLSGGEQQMCAIGRGLMARPKLLLLDEPSLGLAPVLVHEVFKTIIAINQQAVTILLVEQNARQALSIAHYAYVLENGRTVLKGPAH